MIFRTYRPRPPLSEFVDSLWFWQGNGTPETTSVRLPTGSMEFVISLGERPLRVYNRINPSIFQQFNNALVCGVQSQSSVTNSSEAAIGVHFKPGGAFPFLRPPPGELRDQHVSLEDVWGASIRSLREQLIEAETPEAIFGILERRLLTSVVRSLSRHPAVELALTEFMSNPQVRSVSELARLSGYSKRRFIEIFNGEVGLTPKLFFRIQRFQKAVQLTKLPGAVNWSDVAAACGYFDQAHFIRDFRAFSGLNPSAYLSQYLDEVHHGLLGN